MNTLVPASDRRERVLPVSSAVSPEDTRLSAGCDCVYELYREISQSDRTCRVSHTHTVCTAANNAQTFLKFRRAHHKKKGLHLSSNFSQAISLFLVPSSGSLSVVQQLIRVVKVFMRVCGRSGACYVSVAAQAWTDQSERPNLGKV